MGLIEKFNNFEVKQTDRISREDTEWLEALEVKYKRALNVYMQVYEIYRAEWDTYSEDDMDIYHFSNILVGDFGTLKSIDGLQNGYIERIFSYFSSKYNVTLENNFEKSNLDSKYYKFSHKAKPKELEVDVIDYHKVVDRIIEQLGGMSFQDKAVNEIKEKLKDKCYNKHHDIWYIKLTGSKFTYTGDYCSQTYGGDYAYTGVDFFRALLDALAFNAYEEKVHLYPLERLYGYYDIMLKEEDLKNGFTCRSVGVEHIRFYKNGRVDITFKDADFARNFARDWCGFTVV